MAGALSIYVTFFHEDCRNIILHSMFYWVYSSTPLWNKMEHGGNSSSFIGLFMVQSMEASNDIHNYIQIFQYATYFGCHFIFMLIPHWQYSINYKFWNLYEVIFTFLRVKNQHLQACYSDCVVEKSRYRGYALLLVERSRYRGYALLLVVEMSRYRGYALLCSIRVTRSDRLCRYS